MLFTNTGLTNFKLNPNVINVSVKYDILKKIPLSLYYLIDVLVV